MPRTTVGDPPGHETEVPVSTGNFTVETRFSHAIAAGWAVHTFIRLSPAAGGRTACTTS